MENTISLITKKFDEVGIHYYRIEQDLILVGLSGENYPMQQFFFKSKGINSHEVNCVLPLFSVPGEKKAALEPICMEVMSTYPMIKMVLFSETPERNHLLLLGDLPASVCEDCVGACALELFLRIMTVFREIYPKISKILLDGKLAEQELMEADIDEREPEDELLEDLHDYISSEIEAQKRHNKKLHDFLSAVYGLEVDSEVLEENGEGG